MSTPQQNQEVAPNQEFHNSLWRGLLLAGAIAAIAFGLNQIPALRRVNPMLVAVFIGILVQSFLTIPKSCTSGINFSLQKLLKIAIVLLGLQLSFTQLLDVGLQGLLAIMLTLGTTFLFCVWLGKQLGLDPKLTRLIAAGTSICGASAIVATNSVVRGKDEHVAYSITVVTLFGFLSMLLFPVIGRFLELDPTIFGFWSGTSIHETAQVIGAAFQGGQESGEVGTVAKLSRVLFLIPVILILGFLPSDNSKDKGKAEKKRLPIPWFVLGFIALVRFLLTVSLAAMGLHMNLSKIKKTGLRPLCLGAAAWIYVSTVGLPPAKTLG